MNSARNRSMDIDGTIIADDEPCYVIAEIGHNHGGSLETAIALFDAAKEAGADAVKLQKRDNRSLYTAEMFDKPYENENSFGATYGEHREALELGFEEYSVLRDHAAAIGVTFFATAFDEPSVDFLEAIDLPAYKIASADVRNLPLLRRVAATGKPVILSTGGADIVDVRRAHDLLRNHSRQVAVLQCTAGYPAAWEELDLRVIDTFRRMFPETVVGLSSHDNGIAMSVAASVLGGRIVEKHFTLDRASRGTDHRFSLEPQGLRKLVRDLKRLHVAMGDGIKRVHDSEIAPIEKMSKKIVAAKDLPSGHALELTDLALKSPGDGLSPHNLDLLVGGQLRRAIVADEAIDLEFVQLATVDPESPETYAQPANELG